MDLFNLSGRVAIITGGARGIGFAIAKGLVSYGVVIVIADINSGGAQEAKIAIRSLFFTHYDTKDLVGLLFQLTCYLF